MSDGSKKPFNRAAGDATRSTDGKPAALRDKDNAGPQPKPDFAQLPPANLAPPGMSGIKRTPPPETAFGLVIERTETITDVQLSGRLRDRPDVTFTAELTSDPQKMEKHDGPIIKLDLYEKDQLIYSHEQIDVNPKTLTQKEARDQTMAGLMEVSEGLAQKLDQSPPDLTIEDGRFHDNELTDGTVPDRDGMTFTAKVETQNHPDGLNGGPVTFLDLRENGLTVARYDHGWVMEPQNEDDQKAAQSVNDTLERFNRDFKPIVPPEQDNDRDIER